MTEISLPWGGIVTGDPGPYSDDDWSDMYRKLFQVDRATEGIVGGYLNSLAVTGVASPVAVNTGGALVDGKFYENDASASIAIPTPSVSTRIDVIVLRKDWTAQTVRLTRIAGVEGGGAPAITQVDGTTWDIKLAEASINTGGTIVVTDYRDVIKTPLENKIRFAQIQVAGPTSDVGTGDDQGSLFIPPDLDGYALVYVMANAKTAGVTGTMDIQLSIGATDLLSTIMTIDSTETSTLTAATPPVINPANRLVASGDRVDVDVDAVQTTPAKGLWVTVGFQLV